MPNNRLNSLLKYLHEKDARHNDGRFRLLSNLPVRLPPPCYSPNNHSGSDPYVMLKKQIAQATQDAVKSGIDLVSIPLLDVYIVVRMLRWISPANSVLHSCQLERWRDMSQHIFLSRKKAWRVAKLGSKVCLVLG